MQSNRADNILNPMGTSNYNPQARDNNNVLNPQGAPVTQFRAERGSYQNHNSNAGSLIYGGANGESPAYKPSVGIHSHHNKSNIQMTHSSEQPQNGKAAHSELQQRIMEQNRQADLMLQQKKSLAEKRREGSQNRQKKIGEEAIRSSSNKPLTMAQVVPDHVQPKLPPSGKDENVFNMAQPL